MKRSILEYFKSIIVKRDNTYNPDKIIVTPNAEENTSVELKSTQTKNIVINLPDITDLEDTIATRNTEETLTRKTLDAPIIENLDTLEVNNLDILGKKVTLNKDGSDLDSEGSGLLIDRDSSKGSLIYRESSPSRFASGDLGFEDDLVTATVPQTLENKTLETPTVQGGLDTDTVSFREQSSVTPPSADNNLLYFKTDGKLYKMDSSGTEVEVGSGGVESLNGKDGAVVLQAGDNIDIDSSGSNIIISSTSTGILTVATITDRNNIPSDERYEGLLVFVESDNKNYQLHDGITNANWVDISGDQTPNHFSQTINNNQSTPLDIVDANFNSSEVNSFLLNYYISRRGEDQEITSVWQEGDLNSDILNFPPATLSVAVDVGSTSRVWGSYTAPNGKFYLYGSFLNYSGVSGRSNIVRFNADGSVDETFCTSMLDGKFNDAVYTVSHDSLGRIYIGGAFTNYNSVSGHSFLIRFNDDSSVATVYNNNVSANINNVVYSVAVDSRDHALISGAFTNFNGVSGASYYIRTDQFGAVINLNSYANLFNSSVISICLTPTAIYFGGSFTTVNGVSVTRLAKATYDHSTSNPVSSWDNIFNSAISPLFNGSINSLKKSPNNQQLYVEGVFTNFNGVSGRNRLAKLNLVVNSPDESWMTSYLDGKINLSTDFKSNIVQVESDSVVYITHDGMYAASSRSYITKVDSNIVDPNTDTFNIEAENSLAALYASTAQNRSNIYYLPSINSILVSAKDTGSPLIERYALLHTDSDPGTIVSTPIEKQQTGILMGRYIPSTDSWDLGGQASHGTDTGVEFVMSGGQLQYKSSNLEIQDEGFIDYSILTGSGAGSSVSGVSSLNSKSGDIVLSAGSNITIDNSGPEIVINSSAGSPAGADMSIQYNLSGVFGSDSNITVSSGDFISTGIDTAIKINKRVVSGRSSSISLNDGQITEQMCIQFNYSTYKKAFINYSIIRAGEVRVGRIIVATTGSAIAFNDDFSESNPLGITLNSRLNGSNLEIVYQTTNIGITCTLEYSIDLLT